MSVKLSNDRIDRTAPSDNRHGPVAHSLGRPFKRNVVVEASVSVRSTRRHQFDEHIYSGRLLPNSVANNAYVTVYDMATLNALAACAYRVTAFGAGSDSAIAESIVWVRGSGFIGKKDLATSTGVLIAADTTNGIRVQNTVGSTQNLRIIALRVW
jgi:hypothetical protein